MRNIQHINTTLSPYKVDTRLCTRYSDKSAVIMGLTLSIVAWPVIAMFMLLG